MLLLSAANDVPNIKRVSPLAKALFKPLPGTKSNKPMTTTSFRSDTAILYQKPWGNSDSSSLNSKIGENELYVTNVFRFIVLE